MHLVRPEAVALVPGPEAWFTGSAAITPVFSATEETPNGCAYVAFEPGARSAWHTHPAGQLLVVTEGSGWIQQWGEAKREIVAGDVIWTPPGVKHWHGATATAAMTHVAIQQAVGGDVVEWMEAVSDEQYLGPRGEEERTR
ncbi:MAG: cupin domain-containing protein [Candidatus Eisenbacteria bacterium]